MRHRAAKQPAKSKIAERVHLGDPMGALQMGYGNGQTGEGANGRKKTSGQKVRTLPNNARKQSG